MNIKLNDDHLSKDHSSIVAISCFVTRKGNCSFNQVTNEKLKNFIGI